MEPEAKPTPPEETPSLPIDNKGKHQTHIAITLFVIIALIFFYPLGVILMWFLTSWPRWAKIAITFLLILPIFAILLAVVLIAINPARQFAQANDTQRKSDVYAIANAISLYYQDTNTLPPNLQTISPGQTVSISNSDPNTGTAFCEALVPLYIASLPIDPKNDRQFENCASFDTDYTISISQGASEKPIITVSAPKTQLNTLISVTK